MRQRAAFAVCLLLATAGAAAHSTSTAYLDIDATAANAPVIVWRIALRDLDALLDLDADGDGQLTWGEVADRGDDIVALATSKLAVRSGGAACTLQFEPPRFVRLADVGYAQLGGAAACSGAATALDYGLFEGVDPSHRVLVIARGSAQPRIVAPGARVELAAAGSAAEAQNGFGAFLLSGIAHIAGGLDHVLLLLTLLLPAVMLRREGRWVARDDVQSALWHVVWIATAFTIAHSITLALATFEVISFPARIIEPLIALTVLLAALNNLWPVVTNRLAMVAFAFGLIHGFGFAEVLTPLSLPRAELAQALVAFNLGVELGQLAVVAVAFFVLASLRRWPGYPRCVLALGSALIALIAAVWFSERVFGVSIPGL